MGGGRKMWRAERVLPAPAGPDHEAPSKEGHVMAVSQSTSRSSSGTPRPQAAHWTPAELDRLRTLYATHSSEQIAAALGRSVQSVRTRCWLLGLSGKGGRAWGEDEIRHLRGVYAARLSPVALSELAARLGRDKPTVCRKARELGLTNQRRRKREAISLRVIAPLCKCQMAEAARRRIAKYGHPRGMAGKKHTAETLDVLSARSAARWADPNDPLNAPRAKALRSANMRGRHLAGLVTVENAYSRCRRGIRPDLGLFMRSAWEANYARYLNTLVAAGTVTRWEYEPHRFLFSSGSPPYSYMPDFRVTLPDGRHEWHEVKGWLTAASRAALARMSEHYPGERVVLVAADWFQAAERKGGVSAHVPGWER